MFSVTLTDSETAPISSWASTRLRVSTVRMMPVRSRDLKPSLVTLTERVTSIQGVVLVSCVELFIT
jgi:hypothetical protein